MLTTYYPSYFHWGSTFWVFSLPIRFGMTLNITSTLRKKTGDISGVVKSDLYPLFLLLFGLIGFLACQVTKIYEIF